MNKDNKIIIEFGLNRIDELKEKEKKFEEIIKNEKRDLKDGIMLNNFDEYLKKLSYESAKEVIEQIRYILDYKEYEQLKDGILQEIKLRDYPVLDSAYHFPVLNEINFLRKEQIKELDKYLSNPIIEIISSSAIFGKLKIIDYNMVASIIEFILNKNIVEKIYTINCPYCCDEVEKIYKKDYEELIECINEGGAWEEYCNGCNQEIDIENIDTLKKLTEIDYYKIIAEPINTKYDEI